MHHICAPKRLLTGLLASVLAALLVSAAAASPRVIPYLSHGVGVDQSLYSSTSHHLRRTTGVVPTHKAVPDAFERALARDEATQSAAVRPDDRAGVRGIETRTYQASASVRPDDRAGLRGIGGTTSTGPSASASSSSNDWNKAFVAAGGLFALLLLVGIAVVLGKRQPKRLATH